MKNYLLIFFLIVITSCKSDFKVISKTTLDVKEISIRAIQPQNRGVFAGGSNSKFAYFNFNKKEVYVKKIQDAKTDFRSIACQNQIFILNAGSPANLYQIENFDFQNQQDFERISPKIVYNEIGDKVFYDSIFFEGNFGIALGDPVENCMSIIKTNDRGKTWQKMTCENLPKVEDGEVAFATSNTNIKVINDKIFAITGGKKSRLMKSENKGKTWTFYDLPIVQGKSMQGAFSMDFYDENIGMVVGGDYENQKDNSSNKAITFDGGKTWKLISEGIGFGYASCVQFFPNNNGKRILVAAEDGIYYSDNFGKKWKRVLDEKNIYTIRFNGLNKIYLAGKDIVIELNIK